MTGPNGRRYRPCYAARSRPAGSWRTSRKPSPGWRRATSDPASSADLRSRPGCSPADPRPGTARAVTPGLPGLWRGAAPGGAQPAMTLPIWAWAATLAVFAVLMAADLVLTRNAAGFRAAVVSSVLWIAAALAFGGALWLWRGPATAGQYFAGYLLEKALSVNNVFVFVMLFASLQVPAALRRRVLHLGVLGALVLRGGFIAAGGALITHIGWIFYVFGALVLLAGARMLRPGAAAPGHEPRRTGAAAGAAGHRRLRRPALLHPVWPQDPGHALVRGPGGHRGHRPGVRAHFRRCSASPGTCSWCSRPMPSPSSACGRSTSCWPARSTGSPTSSRESPCCWCSSG